MLVNSHERLAYVKKNGLWKLSLHIGVFWSHVDAYEDGKTERMLYRL